MLYTVAHASDAAPAAAPTAPALSADAAPTAAPVDAPAPPAEPASTPAEKADEDPLGSLSELVKAVKEGNWRYAASLVLALLMLGLSKARRWGPMQKAFSGDRGGALLVGILALAGAFATALASSEPLDWKLFVGAAGVMFTAVGGYTWIKRLVWPSDRPATSDKPATPATE